MENDKLDFDIKANLDNWNEILHHPRVGELMVQRRKITIYQLGEALEKQAKENTPIGEILLEMNLITKDELIELLELQVDIDRMLNESFDELKNTTLKD